MIMRALIPSPVAPSTIRRNGGARRFFSAVWSAQAADPRKLFKKAAGRGERAGEDVLQYSGGTADSFP